MSLTNHNPLRSAYRITALLVASFSILLLVSSWRITYAAPEEQKSFSSPERAVQELVIAVRTGDQGALLAILGPEAKELVSSGDSVADKSARQVFVKEYETKHVLVPSGKDVMILRIGADPWSLPIPIVSMDGAWHFDTAAGKQEMLYRRIGHNELGAIAVCKTYVQLQREYAETGHDGRPAGIYAQRLMSDPGKQNGLYWETKPGDPPSPAGPFFAQASAEGYSMRHSPYHGYYYRILTAQGPAAARSVKHYVVDGDPEAEFALLAYPAEYGSSGVMTFFVNRKGVVYQKNLGEKTADIATQISTQGPDKTWTRVH